MARLEHAVMLSREDRQQLWGAGKQIRIDITPGVTITIMAEEIRRRVSADGEERPKKIYAPRSSGDEGEFECKHSLGGCGKKYPKLQGLITHARRRGHPLKLISALRKEYGRPNETPQQTIPH